MHADQGTIATITTIIAINNKNNNVITTSNMANRFGARDQWQAFKTSDDVEQGLPLDNLVAELSTLHNEMVMMLRTLLMMRVMTMARVG